MWVANRGCTPGTHLGSHIWVLAPCSSHPPTRFAVDFTQDADLVVRALARVTYCNETPAELNRWDQAMAHHPSLFKRVNSIREYARQIGLPAGDGDPFEGVVDSS